MTLACLLAQASGGSGAATQQPTKAARDAFEKAAKAAQNKKTDEALRNYQKAVALDPDYAEAWCELGKLQLAEDQLDEARSSLGAAIKADPDYAETYKALVVLENKAKNWKELVNVTDRLLKLDPAGNWQAYFFNAVGNYNAQNFEAAEKSAREAERLDTQHRFPTTWQLLGGVLARRGDFAGAAEQYREYLKWKPDGPDSEAVRARLADMEKRAGGAAPGAPSSATFRVDANLALVRFQVIPRKGQFVTDLRPEDIEIREDGIPQQIGLFEGGRFYPRTVPLEIALLFDCSGSVQFAGTLDPRVFDENLLKEYENVAIAIYAFSDDLVRLTGPTRDGPALLKAMEAVQSAQELGVALCPVMLPQPTGAQVDTASNGEWELRKLQSIGSFMKLASDTGGQAFNTVSTKDVLPTILKSLANHVRYDYVAGFYPSSSGGGKRHKIEVILRSKNRGEMVGGVRALVH